MDDHPRRGELRLVVAAHARRSARLGLVLRTHRDERVIEIALVHSSTELATSADAVVDSTLAGTPYDLVVQSDLRGVVWSWQVTRHIGRLSVATLASISASLTCDRPDNVAGVGVGTRLAGPCDRRWAFKRDEGLALDSLTGACTASMLERN